MSCAWDQQYDSPGHTASISKSDALECKTHLCVDVEVLEKKETGESDRKY